MATLTIRKLSEEVHLGLRIRAAHAGRSVEAEVREILQQAAKGTTDGTPFAQIVPMAVQTSPHAEEAEPSLRPASQLLHRQHDSKTCRLYRCGQCAFEGVKDKTRGLE